MADRPRTDALVLWVRPEHMAEMVDHLSAMGLVFTDEQHELGPRHFAAQVGDKVLEIYPTGGETKVRLLRDGPAR